MNAATLYAHKLTPVEAALQPIPHGGRILIGSGCAEPMVLSQGLTEYALLFAANPIIHIATQGKATYVQPEYADNFRYNA